MDNLERQLSSLCGEKENLEAMLYDVQNNLEVSENRGKQMDREKQELLIKQVRYCSFYCEQLITVFFFLCRSQ